MLLTEGNNSEILKKHSGKIRDCRRWKTEEVSRQDGSGCSFRRVRDERLTVCALHQQVGGVWSQHTRLSSVQAERFVQGDAEGSFQGLELSRQTVINSAHDTSSTLGEPIDDPLCISPRCPSRFSGSGDEVGA